MKCHILFNNYHGGNAIGGESFALLSLMKHLDRDRFDITLLCIEHGIAVDLFRKNGINILVIPQDTVPHSVHLQIRWYNFTHKKIAEKTYLVYKNIFERNGED